MTAPLILAFDTAAAHCAAAVLSGDTVLASVQEPMAKGQAERLLTLVEEMLTGLGLGMSQLDAIGVGVGPGNFTGIRISVSAARGLALALDIPAVGVGNLQAQAYGHSGMIISSLDARRGMIYCQVLGGGATSDPVVCKIDDLPPFSARAEPVCVGHQADLIAARCAGRVALPTVPVAEAIARITASRYSNLPSAPAPMYLRAADAAPARDAPPCIVP